MFCVYGTKKEKMKQNGEEKLFERERERARVEENEAVNNVFM